MATKQDYGFYLTLTGVAVLLIWAVLKSIGVIRSPVWVEMLPFFAIAASFGGIASTIQHTASYLNEFKKETKQELHEIKDKISCLDKDVAVLKDRQAR